MAHLRKKPNGSTCSMQSHPSAVKFNLPEDDVDAAESGYLTHATKQLLNSQSISTDEDSSYPVDRLNSNDFFDAPEAAIAVPKTRVKRVSLEKNRGHFKSKSDERTIKRRQARDLKYDLLTYGEPEEHGKKRTSKSEVKLRHKSRSMERDDKNDPTKPSAIPLHRSNAVDPDHEACNAADNSDAATDPSIDSLVSSYTDSFRQRHGSGGASRRRHGSGDNSRDSDSERKMFHKKFLLTIKLGKRVYRDREEKRRNLGSDKAVPYNRQYSDLFYAGHGRINPDCLFYSLQAYRKKMAAEDYMEMMCRYKERIPEKIKMVLSFQFVPESKYVDDNICDLLNNPFNISNDYLDNVEAAVEQVKEVLESIDLMESLFPTNKSLTSEFEQSDSAEYKRKVAALNMWVNNADALMATLKISGSLIWVEKMPCIMWPFVESLEECLTSSVMNSSGQEEYSNSTPASPDVDSESSPGNSVSRRKVTFDSRTLSSSPSTHVTTSSNSNDSSTSHHMYMNNQYATVDIQASPTSFYRPVVDKMLRKSSLMDIISARFVPVGRPLLKAKCAIINMEMEPVVDRDKKVSPHVIKYCDVLVLTPDQDMIDEDEKVKRRELSDHFPTLYEQFTAMNLPSLIPMYVFLARFPLDMTHECLRLRLEQQIANPSLPIIRQVVRECSEAAKVAISIKQSYQYLLAPVAKKYSISDELLERHIERFNMDVKEILEVYFGYVEYGMDLLKKETSAPVVKNFLEEEWSFSKEICPFITGGMAEASKRFCGMCSTLLQWIQNHLEQELDRALFESNPTVYSSEGLSSPQSDCAMPGLDASAEDVCTTTHYRRMLINTGRDIKLLFSQMREWASKALTFAKILRKDLEISAEFEVKVKSTDLMKVLQGTKHVRVITPNTAHYIVLAPASIKDDIPALLALLDVTCGREDCGAEPSSREGYLLLINTGEDDIVWSGEEVKVEPKTETTIALSHIAVERLFLIVAHSSQLSRQRKEFCNVAGSAVLLVNEQTTCHQTIAEAWDDLRVNAYDLANAVKTAIEHVENQLDSTDLQSLDTDGDRKTIKATYRSTLDEGYLFGFELLQEFNKIHASCGERRDTILLAFANQWIEYVLKNYERGKGTRPSWANGGFDFLSIVVEPSITRSLSDEDFEELQGKIEKVVEHIIGSASSNGSPQHAHHGGNRAHALPANNNPYRFLSVEGMKSSRQLSTGSNSSTSSRKGPYSEPATPYDRTDSKTGSYKWYGGGDTVDLDLCPLDAPSQPATPHIDSWRTRSESGGSLSQSTIPGVVIHRLSNERKSATSPIYESPTFHADMLPPDRAQAATNALDHRLDDVRRKKRMIGRVTECQHHVNIVKINVRKVNFKWQRGVKIGEGAFGKVYTAINCDTNCMMAMKELKFQPNDVQSIKSIADELKTFEGINHENLVKYYGIEVHKDEIFIFMEYCNEGTLEQMSKDGIHEPLIRRYTKELVLAVDYLHEHNIIHRDIKGANIFLVPNDKLKLGDFGCSAKLKEHTTMPGEMVAFVGTAAFMAPEVVTQKGYGRSADIWSLGCVVVEMVTRKRPWHDSDNVHQIMFKVGMGNIPSVPESFHQEGKDFLSCCFKLDPHERSTANELLAHMFLKVAKSS